MGREKTLAEIQAILDSPWTRQVELLRKMTRRELEVLCFILTRTQVEDGNRKAFEQLQMAVFSVLRDFWSKPERMKPPFDNQSAQ